MPRPVLLLIVAVSAAMICLWWFLLAAIETERVAARQRLSETNDNFLQAAQGNLLGHWSEHLRKAEVVGNNLPAPEAFAEIVQRGIADSVVCRGEESRDVYPAFGAIGDPPIESNSDSLEQCRALLRNLRRAISVEHWSDAHKLAAKLKDPIYRSAIDRNGRVIPANGVWLFIESHPDSGSVQVREHAEWLADYLNDYTNVAIPASQRRFLMRSLKGLRDNISFPTLQAEDLAARYLLSQQMSNPSGHDHTIWSPLPGVWASQTADRSVTILMNESKLQTLLQSALKNDSPGPKVIVSSRSAPGSEDAASLSIGSTMPGWELQLGSESVADTDPTVGKVATLYIWLGVLATLAMALIAWLICSGLLKEARQAQLKQDLASAVSHELRTPLSSMRVFVDLLLEDEELDQAKTREYLELMSKENSRLTQLVENFLTFSRLKRQEDRSTYNYAQIDTAELLSETAAAARRSFAGGRLEVELEPELSPIVGEPAALHSAITNLLDNACKYSPGESPVKMRGFGRNGDVCVEVQDQGPGLNGSEKRAAFDAFDRLSKGNADHPAGCGLGLYIVQTVVGQLGGSVEIDSPPGSGSIFRIVVPAAAEKTGAEV